MARQHRQWSPRDRELTDEQVFWKRGQHRREFLAAMGRGIAATSSLAFLGQLAGCSKPTLEELDAAGRVEAGKENYPAKKNPAFEYGRAETDRAAAAEFTNFYEFSPSKSVYLYVADFEPAPWSISLTGLCRQPRTLDLDDIYKEFMLEERAYRHRCVETWAMCVPWTGFPLAELVKAADPLPEARFVKFVTFHRPELTTQMSIDDYPWPYTESLSLQEATNPLPFVATGIYGQPLPKQHGAPIRLVVPWKYGFKSIKSIVTIEFTASEPATFWNTLGPDEYDTIANVDPDVPHPRWSQKFETMLGTGERFETVKYNGYGEHVASLYLD